MSEREESVGTLTEIMHTGANDVYVVTREHGGEVLLPAIPSVVLEVNVEWRTIRVRLPSGLPGADTG
jgi:16S rRNA processing protein RimM